MIHTIRFSTYLSQNDQQVIFEKFKPLRIMGSVRTPESIIYFYRREGLSYTYLKRHNLLLIKFNPGVLLNKEYVGEADYSDMVKQVMKRFNKIFKYTDPFMMTNRIDYRLDFKVDQLSTYLKLIKKCDNFRKAPYKYDSSMYYKGSSYNVSVYDKETEQLDRLESRYEAGCISEEEYEDSAEEIRAKYHGVLRIELQLKRRFFKSQEERNNLSLADYWTVEMRDKLMEQYVWKKLYKGDHCNSYNSRKRLELSYNESTVKKLISLQSGISLKGIKAARAQYSNPNTFNNHLKMLIQAGINPVPIPNNEKISRLPGLYSLFMSGQFIKVASDSEKATVNIEMKYQDKVTKITDSKWILPIVSNNAYDPCLFMNTG